MLIVLVMLDGQLEEDREDEGGEMTLGIRWVYYDDAGSNERQRYEKGQAGRHRLTTIIRYWRSFAFRAYNNSSVTRDVIHVFYGWERR